MISAVNFRLTAGIQQQTGIKSKAPVFKGIPADVFVSSSPKISKLNKKNLKEIFPIYLRYRNSANVESSISEVKRYLQQETKTPGENILTARVNNQIIGFLHYGTEHSTLRPGERIRLKAMFIDEEYRGRGISKKMLQHVQQEAGEREIIVKARRSNEVSPHLYLNNGFKEDEEYIHLVYRNK